MAVSANPKQVTIRGRLSFPVFDYQQAVARNATSQYPKADKADVTPEFHLLLEQTMLDKFTTHVLDVFLPYCEQQHANGEKRDALDPKQVEKIRKLIESEDWENQPPYISIKPVPEKTQELAPEALVSLKVIGQKATDMEQQAIVRSEDELAVPDPDRVQYPVILPIGQTTHNLYGGCNAVATLNLFAFVSGKQPGFSASASVCVFHSDNDRFGGGVAVDEDAMFMD